MIVAKSQKSGGQEAGPSDTLVTPGELTEAFGMYLSTFGYATYSTAPMQGVYEGIATADGATNIFDDVSCSGAACQGKTEINAWHTASNGYVYPGGCLEADCSETGGSGVREWVINPDRTYRLEATWKGASILGAIVHLEGHVVLPGETLPVISPVAIEYVYPGAATSWNPRVSKAYGVPTTCSMVTQPRRGVMTIEPDCSGGTYTPDPDFSGKECGEYQATDGANTTPPASICACSSVCADVGDTCLAQYPVSQFSQTGKVGTITISFTGNIVAHTSKTVKVCPGTNLNYQASSTKGPLVCRVNSNTTRDTGTLGIDDYLKCNDKPAGKDKIQLKVKSMVAKQ